jgi:hypothetical protein
MIGNYDSIQVLLKHRADPMIIGPLLGRNCVHMAAESGDLEVHVYLFIKFILLIYFYLFIIINRFYH